MSKPRSKKKDHIFLPSQVTIIGKIFSVTRNEKGCGGQFDGHRQTIVWNAATQQGAEDTLLHEIAEMIMCERRRRFHKAACNEQGDLLFVLTHDEFEDFIHDLYASVSPFLDFAHLEKVLK